jgi:hypothetical protein
MGRHSGNSFARVFCAASVTPTSRLSTTARKVDLIQHRLKYAATVEAYFQGASGIKNPRNSQITSHVAVELR